MRAVIVGCGRVGAGLAERLARAGHEVTVLDINTDAFGRLPSDFPGAAVRGDGTDEDILRRAGADGADLFFALTEGDNRNILAAQLANETFGVPDVVAKVNDPVRAEAYTTLGINTICRTTILVEGLARFAGLPAEEQQLGVARATGHHRGGEHHAVRLQSSREAAGAGPGNAQVGGYAQGERDGRRARDAERIRTEATVNQTSAGDAGGPGGEAAGRNGAQNGPGRLPANNPRSGGS
jgi:trk system potassium uptake protein TrkA